MSCRLASVFQLTGAVVAISPMIWRRPFTNRDTSMVDLHRTPHIAAGWGVSCSSKFLIAGECLEGIGKYQRVPVACHCLRGALTYQRHEKDLYGRTWLPRARANCGKARGSYSCIENTQRWIANHCATVSRRQAARQCSGCIPHCGFRGRTG